MASRVVSLAGVFILLCGCGGQGRITEGPEQAEIRKAEMEATKNRKGGGAPKLSQKFVPKQWDKSRPKIAALLEKRRQLILDFPVPWSSGQTLVQATSETKARLEVAKKDAKKDAEKKEQDALAKLDQTRIALEDNGLIFTTNELIKLESRQLKIQRAGVDPSLEDGAEVKGKVHFKTEQTKKDQTNQVNTTLKNLYDFKDQLEGIETQLIAESK